MDANVQVNEIIMRVDGSIIILFSIRTFNVFNVKGMIKMTYDKIIICK